MRHVLSAVLIAAALLKAHQAATDPIARAGLRGAGPPWLQVAAVQLELFIAAWLLSNLYPLFARRAAIGLFATYACVSLYRLVSGRTNCGCFGAAAVHPGWVLALDVVLLAALAWWNPTAGGVEAAPRAATTPRPGRRWAALASSCLLAAAVAFTGWWMIAQRRAAAAEARNASAGLVCREPVYDFGPVSAQRASALEHRFVLTGATAGGARPVRVVNTITSCGCTRAALATNPVPVGGSTDLVAAVDWGNRDGPQATHITLVTDEVPPATVHLALLGRVVRPVTVRPRSIDFGELDPGLSGEAILEVEGTPSSEPVNVTDVRVTNPAIRVRRIEATPQDGATRFGVRVLVPRRPAAESGDVLLATASESAGHIAVRVAARSRGVIAADPKSLLLRPARGHGGGGGDVQAALRVRVACPQDALTLRASIVASADSRPPLHVRSLTTSSSAAADGRPGLQAEVVVVYDGDGARNAVAALRLTYGDDSLDVPVVVVPAGGAD